jgi:hypothetical protein
MWQSRIQFKTSTARHSKLKSAAYWGITQAKMMTPTAATKALLEFPVLHLKLKLRPGQESMDSTVLGNGDPNLKGWYVLKHGVGIQPMNGTDRITPRYAYNKSSIVMIEGKGRQVPAQQKWGTSLVYRLIKDEERHWV